MSNEFSREGILSRLQNEVFRVFQNQLIESVSKETTDIAELLQRTKDAIDSGETDEALKKLIQALSSRFQSSEEKEETASESEPVTSPLWIQELHSITAELEDQIQLQQQEDRFQSLKTDSGFIKTSKLVKRLRRGSQKAGKTIGSLFTKENTPNPVWKQEVPLQNLVRFFMLDVHEVLRDWEHQFRKIQAEILLETDAWILTSTGLVQHDVPEQTETETEESDSDNEVQETVTEHEANQIPDQEDMEVFFEEALNELNSIRKSFEENLDLHFQSIQDQVNSALSITGTIEQSASDFDEEAIRNKEKKVTSEAEKSEKKWSEILNALLDRCLLSMDFIVLYKQSKERIDGFSSSLDEFFTDHFETPAHTLLEQLELARELFEDSDSEKKSKKEIQQLSQQHQQEMTEHIEQNLLKPLNELINDAVLGTKLERFTSAIPEWTKNQREKAILVETLDLTKFPPTFELENVDWQSLVQRVLNNQIAKVFVPKEVKPEEFLSGINTEIQEIAQIIFTNIEIADEVKSSDEEDPLQVAKEGLERARVQLEEVIAKVSAKNSELKDRLSEKKQTSFSKLAKLLDKQNVNEVRLAGAQYMAKETAVDWKIKFQIQWAKVKEKAELLSRFIWMKVKSYYEVVSKFLGFTEKEKLEGDTTDLATFLSKTDEQIASLPFIYRRLFDFHKEVEDRFYIRKPEQFERLKKGYELWQNNFPSSFSIVGEKGSGKTLFTRMLMNDVLTKHDVLEINFPDTIWEPKEVLAQISKGLKIDDAETFEDLIAAIKRKKKRVVVILENVQNCYIRNISGFEAMEQLLLLISETNKEILWIASSTRYGWLYLDKVLNVADYFTHAVETDNLSAQQVEELVLKRHRASGYQLKFLPDEAAKNNRNYKKYLGDEEKSQEYLKERYFDKLSKMSEGNSSVAMIYWIRSIKEYDDTHFYINPFEFGAVNRIQELDSTELFALAAFVLHDTITADELSKTIHQSKRESQLLASRLSSQSILVEGEYGFSINQLIYRQIVRALKEANFIH